MPELPEVETVRRQLQQYLPGKKVATVEVFHSKTVGHSETIEADLYEHTISAIDRVGKLLIFSFLNAPDLYLLAHLKMTGQFFFVDDSVITGGGHTYQSTELNHLPNRHTRLTIHFSDHTQLHFNDMRLFGYVRVANATAMEQARSQFGPEPIAPDFTSDTVVARLRKRTSPIKAVLLDQSLIAGLGNIYVDETLWAAKVRPSRRANRLSKAQATEICEHARTILTQAIAAGGTTFKNFLDTGGQHGNYTDYLHVFGKQGTPCPRCGTTITKVKLAGRGTHFCPGCQR